MFAAALAVLLAAPPPPAGLHVAAAGRFASLALECVAREYPNKIAHLLRPDAPHHTLGATHRELFEQPALHAWMNRLAETLPPPQR